MFETVNASQAQARHWDVIIAGSSFASMFFLYGLPKDLSVLIVEKGGIQEHWDQIENQINGLEEWPMSNTSGHEKEWVAHTVFGGNSNCWWGQTPRFHPDDFKLRTTAGVGEDWPISYDDLEAYYGEVETVMEISGGGNEAILPRSTPFPYPPHIPSLSDAVLQDFDARWFPAPTARSNGGSRANCCSNGVCHLCPIDAKFTILNASEKFTRPGVSLLHDAEIYALETSAGIVKTAEIRAGGKNMTLTADLFALGTNAVNNAVILLRSGFDNPLIGTHLHEQTSLYLKIDVPQKNYFGGTSITGHGYQFYDNIDRSLAAAVMIENYNAPVELRQDKDRWTERLSLKLIAEDLPQQENRILLRDDAPFIEWKGHSDYALAGLKRATDQIQSVLPWEIESLSVSDLSRTEAHIQGTTKMGTDTTSSVVNANLNYHGVPNLFVLGSGAFPSCSPANPTLTLSALSLRAARMI